MRSVFGVCRSVNVTDIWNIILTLPEVTLTVIQCGFTVQHLVILDWTVLETIAILLSSVHVDCKVLGQAVRLKI